MEQHATAIGILQTGHPLLRERTQPLTAVEIKSDRIQALISTMREVMHRAGGVGLAAPQIGQPLRLAVIEDPEEYMQKLTEKQIAERERRPIDFHVLINPHLVIEDSSDSRTFFESCLSIKGFCAAVPRARSVRVTALNERAEPVEINATGWYARILQHEIDHLDGILYIDRMFSRSFTMDEQYSQYWRSEPIDSVLKGLRIDHHSAKPFSLTGK